LASVFVFFDHEMFHKDTIYIFHSVLNIMSVQGIEVNDSPTCIYLCKIVKTITVHPKDQGFDFALRTFFLKIYTSVNIWGCLLKISL
jgi:hypothetical protein